MRLGGGKQHGRYWMASNMVDSTSMPNLAQIRAQSTSSSVPIRPRQASTLQQMAALQATVERMEAERVERERERAQREAERAEWEVLRAQRAAEAQRMQDMFSFMSSLGTTLPGVVVPQSLLAPVVPPTPLALGTPSSGSNPTPSPQHTHPG
ncbi:uncharacterized protein [Miscanthus floridulus]|uniref:uncharacterized protein n=1 Tax=Miscanthus floridulus TaxID=154761 RepID=UPI00345998B0